MYVLVSLWFRYYRQTSHPEANGANMVIITCMDSNSVSAYQTSMPHSRINFIYLPFPGILVGQTGVCQCN